MKLAILGVPSSIGARSSGTEMAPEALRRACLRKRLLDRGHRVEDRGDLPHTPYTQDTDPARARCQNLPAVRHVAESLAPRVEAMLRDGFCPLVLGGDCTIALGSMCGAVRVHPGLGLAYLDRDAELNTPRTSRSGILDGMVIAHLLGRGVPELAHLEGEEPLLKPGHLALLGVERLDPPEIPVFEALPSYRVKLGELRRAGGESIAREARRRLEEHGNRFFIHFDLDLLDGSEMPAVDFATPGGLSLEESGKLLSGLVDSPSFVGLEITNFNPNLDPQGQNAEKIVALVADSYFEELKK